VEGSFQKGKIKGGGGTEVSFSDFRGTQGNRDKAQSAGKVSTEG